MLELRQVIGHKRLVASLSRAKNEPRYLVQYLGMYSEQAQFKKLQFLSFLYNISLYRTDCRDIETSWFFMTLNFSALGMNILHCGMESGNPEYTCKVFWGIIWYGSYLWIIIIHYIHSLNAPVLECIRKLILSCFRVKSFQNLRTIVSNNHSSSI